MKYIRRLLIYINIIIIAGMIVTGYAGVINPASHPFASLLPFAFPPFLFANMLFLIGWAIIRLRNIWLPLLGFILAYSPTQTYCPVNRSAEHPEGSIKVLSYNVLAFNPHNGERNQIMEYLLHSDADIICIQEFAHITQEDSLWHLLDSTYQYQDTLKSHGYTAPNGDQIAILSKYPIVNKEHLEIVTPGNTAGVFDVKINGDTVHVLNLHLQSVGLTIEDKDVFSNIVHGQTDSIAVKNESKSLLKKLAQSAKVRAPQADIINDYIRRHRDERIIVMGDLNDPPLSYTHRTIASRLTDCYREAGHWMGYSFHYHSMLFRIDNIMCSDHWTPYKCVVDKSIDWSDHYPIYCYLKPKNNEE